MSKPQKVNTNQWPNELFSCVYRWVNGRPIEKAVAAKAILQTTTGTPLNDLAVRLSAFAIGNVTPEWLTDNGFSSNLAPEPAREKREAVVLEFISRKELVAVLADADRINSLFNAAPPPVEQAATPALNQMGASQRGDVLLARYSGALAINGDSDTVHHYDGVIWKPIADKELQRAMAAIYREAEISYSQPGIKSAVDTMKLSLPRMGATERHLIGFTNGVFDTKAGEFRPHRREDWLLIASSVEFSQAHEGETLATHAPNFWKWLTRSTGGNTRKADRVLAALYMVMANRYDWQLFLEVTGPGGSGKSVFAEVCTMLAGKGNTVAASMSSLENPKERELIVGASLIVLSDMARYAGDGSGIKAITGGDKVAVDPKYKAPYSMRIPAVVLAVNNNSMTFSDRSGGISRRRVIFNFADVVPDGERDIHLPEKIEAELAVIIRHLLTRFAKQQEAKGLLLEQRQSEEALAVKREGDSLVDFCGYLMAMVECEGMFIGNAEIIPFAPRRYLYHAYMAYMSAHGLGKPVSLTRFGKDMPGSMAEYGKEYKKAESKKKATRGRIQSNITLLDEAEEWLPAATGGGDPMGNEQGI
ncbi:phage/plasmid primase, P4 family [Serratia sp. JSRIV004]|uniref:DNA primase family protein n=2 Tax=unclassified Serratia (in: enterobacteria) TaxID=2647522 RepID=UPI001CBE0BB8|nr:phage/plasmid primase, P4 family [Serratia sp. JSRIV004]UAN56977.1 DNA primase [Serratia sp. JSRIV004]